MKVSPARTQIARGSNSHLSRGQKFEDRTPSPVRVLPTPQPRRQEASQGYTNSEESEALLLPNYVSRKNILYCVLRRQSASCICCRTLKCMCAPCTDTIHVAIIPARHQRGMQDTETLSFEENSIAVLLGVLSGLLRAISPVNYYSKNSTSL